MSKLSIAMLTLIISVFVVGLVYFTKDLSIAKRDISFELLSLGVLGFGSLFTYLGIRYNLKDSD